MLERMTVGRFLTLNFCSSSVIFRSMVTDWRSFLIRATMRFGGAVFSLQTKALIQWAMASVDSSRVM